MKAESDRRGSLVGVPLIVAFLTLGSACNQAESGRDRSPSDASGSEAERWDETETASSRDGNGLWNACVSLFGDEPYRLSDIFEVASREGRELEIERSGNQIVVRSRRYDALQRRTAEGSVEFIVRNAASQSTYCGPIETSIGRAVIDGRTVDTASETQRLTLELLGLANQSDEGRRRREARMQAARERAQQRAEEQEEQLREAQAIQPPIASTDYQQNPQPGASTNQIMDEMAEN